MYSLVNWSPELDLTEFYRKAESRGFVNNSSQKMLVDCFSKEPEWQVWVLYYNRLASGTVAAHSLPELGTSAYRICARTCVLTDQLPLRQLRSLTYTCQQHQNVTGQFFIPKCIEWAGKDKDLYITSHPSDVGTQRLVHNIYCPALVETGALERTCELEYRGHVQTFWKLNIATFLEQLNSLPRWELTIEPGVGRST
jgi:hypothetical protein